MSVLVVGSVALDTVETPFGRVEEAVGGSATFFSASASLFQPVSVVGVVGSDYPVEKLDFLARRGVDLTGLDRSLGESFRWSGVYGHGAEDRTTIETRLGVFAQFKPDIPEAARGKKWVFLGNIDPELQLDVLNQMNAPQLVGCDTMNYWIEGKRQALLEVLRRVDVLLLNDSEARQLSGQHELVNAAGWIRDRGPRYVVVKKGEHGAVVFGPELVFFVPGYPLGKVVDPTGAGDAFAGGFMGHLARAGHLGDDELRRAMVYGTVMGSFAVESFSVGRLSELEEEDVARRVLSLWSMTSFQHQLPAAQP